MTRSAEHGDSTTEPSAQGLPVGTGAKAAAGGEAGVAGAGSGVGAKSQTKRRGGAVDDAYLDRWGHEFRDSKAIQISTPATKVKFTHGAEAARAHA